MSTRFKIGSLFPDFKTLDYEISMHEKENCINLWKQHTRTIKAEQKRNAARAELIKDDLKYSEITYWCVRGGKKHSAKITDAVHPRWTLEYYRTYKPTFATPRRNAQVSIQPTPRKNILTENKKYNNVSFITQQINKEVSKCGMITYKDRLSQLEAILNLWKEGKQFVVTEVVEEIELNNTIAPVPSIIEESSQPSTSNFISSLPEIDVQLTQLEDIQSDILPDIPDAQESNTQEPNTEESNTQESNTQESNTPTLSDITFPKVSKKRGRPKGSCKTAIGLPKKKRKYEKTTFNQKDVQTKQRQILSWFIEIDKVSDSMKGILLGEESVETIPENIPSACLDSERVDIHIIRKYFDSDGWAALINSFNERQNLPWYCKSCAEDVNTSPSIGCDSCLEWQHYSCIGLKKAPKTKYWFCNSCK